VLVTVALPLPLFRNFTYEVDDAQAARARVGMRAVVPFRNKREMGVIVGVGELAPGVTPKKVFALPDTEPVIGEDLLAVCQWIAEYYVVPLGIAIRTVLPAALGSQAAPEPSRRTRRGYRSPLTHTVGRALPIPWRPASTASSTARFSAPTASTPIPT